jgi:hypothetical protein
MPMTLSAVVVSVVWGSILTDNGILNAVLKQLNLSGLAQSWIGSQTLALPSVAFIVSWQMVGFCMVIYLADLQSIPKELVEAAKIDGCTERQLFRQISWPLLAGSLTINTTVLSLVGLRLYDQVIVVTAGGPVGSTETIATTMVRTAIPSPLVLTHVPTSPVGTSSLTITGNVEGAVVSVTQNGVVLATGTIAGGSAVLNFNPLSSLDSLEIIGFSFNTKPYLGGVTIVPITGPSPCCIWKYSH